uniref:NADH dehydrogenase subunit 6 n=1 Tax=Vaejovis mexicanus smithi TaxID=1562928 RepID=A0A343AXZ5_VAEMS|nr:NADH dehydrogenase subunit 6 [Vaejovis smithi]APW29079.1 NADH dehydrogenase subunit 6 [Vaejovis smithi]
MFGLVMFSSLGFLISIHPLIMGIFLMFTTSLIAFCSYFVFGFSWYSYIMILVFLGGMLILFIYVASLASNEFVKMKSFYWMMGLILFIIPIGDWIFIKSSYSVTKIYENFPMSLITLFLASYLLITFIGVVKLVSMEEGPLREYTYGKFTKGTSFIKNS